jgi:superfamily I DNA/RNA helicase
MHLAKGLEFKAVAVIACDEDQLPLRSRVEVVADEVGLDDVYATERHLFYAACTHLIQSRRTGHRIDLTR